MFDPHRHRPVALIVAVVLPLAASAACGRRPPADPPAPVLASASAPAPSTATAVDPGAARRAEEERARLAREAEARDRAARERAALDATRRALEEPVRFPYDRFDLTADTRSLLETKVAIFQGNPTLTVRIDGHADERGSDEYNLALAQRRAGAVQRYLSSRGISEARISVRSLGEEDPDCFEATELCWERNRRAEFAVTAGQITTPLP